MAEPPEGDKTGRTFIESIKSSTFGAVSLLVTGEYVDRLGIRHYTGHGQPLREPGGVIDAADEYLTDTKGKFYIETTLLREFGPSSVKVVGLPGSNKLLTSGRAIKFYAEDFPDFVGMSGYDQYAGKIETFSYPYLLVAR